MHIKHRPFLAFLCLMFLLAGFSAHASEQDRQAAAVRQACELAAGQQDLVAALARCEELAELGHRHAQLQMGNFYTEGVLLAQDYAAAVHWYTQASAQGDAQAQLQLGLMYAKGMGVPVNKAQAFIILKMSAVNGSDEAYDYADLVLLEMSSQELDIANRVLAKIFLRFVQSLQHNSQSQAGYGYHLFMG